MFADDLLIFYRANTDDAICIKMILEKISISSSEIANSAKYSIHFSSNNTPLTKMDSPQYS